MSTWRIMAGDLEDQVECPVIALAVLAKFRAHLDRAAANDLGHLHVSSTLQELADERATARAAIEALQLIPVMFELGARPHPADALNRAYLAP
jgi:hypothetical protein